MTQMTAANASLIKQAQLTNLSITGALVKVDFRPPRVLSRVEIVFGSSVSRQGDALRVAAYVTRNYQKGIGVEWCEWASPAVIDLVSEARAQSPSVQQARPANSAPPAMPIEHHTEELQEKSFLFIKWIANMNSLLDAPSVPPYRSPLEALGLKMPEATMVAGIPKSLHWAQSAHERMVAIRQQRISIVAYLLAEKRGFEPGHAAEDWLRAESVVNAQDAGTAQT